MPTGLWVRCVSVWVWNVPGLLYAVDPQFNKLLDSVSGKRSQEESGESDFQKKKTMLM